MSEPMPDWLRELTKAPPEEELDRRREEVRRLIEKIPEKEPA